MIAVNVKYNFKIRIFLSNVNYNIFYTLNGANRVLSNDMVSTFFISIFLKCRDPPSINLQKNKLIGGNDGKKAKKKET